MSTLTELLRQVAQKDSQLAESLDREFKALQGRRAFGLNFERHQPETVELPGRPIRRGDKVHVLPPRDEPKAKADKRLWRVTRIKKTGGKTEAGLVQPQTGVETETATCAVDDLVVVAEFRDPIYPGLISTGKVERGGDAPFHTVINAENFHALQALTYTHTGKIDAIYIDPPYNTGAKDWKYNNDYVDGEDAYRHSKWLAMMERRLKLSRRLLNPDNAVLICTIDEKEYLRLGLLLEQVFPDARIQMVSSAVNTAAVARAGAFGRSDEYLYSVKIGTASPKRVELSREWVSSRGRTHNVALRWDLLRRSGKKGSRRADSPGCFYPIYVSPDGPRIVKVGESLPDGTSEPESVDGAIPILPIRKDNSEGRWQWSPSTLKSRIKQGRVRISGATDKGFTVSILKPGEYKKIVDGEVEVAGYNPDGSVIVETQNDTDMVRAIPSTQWRIASHDATQYGTRLLGDSFLPNRDFPYPKSLYAVEDALRFFVADKPNATILDFFSGSGTTAHAVMRLNKQDGGQRQCISITNNEVAADEQMALRKQGLRPGDADWEQWGICDYITKPRLRAAITGQTPEGEPIKGDYKFTDEFSMADGFAANVEFFTMTYEARLPVAHNHAFARIAPLLWLKAGAQGRRIDQIADHFAVADCYAILFDVDAGGDFVTALEQAGNIGMAFIVTDDDASFQSVCMELPEGVEAVRLYSSYLTNFTLNAGGV